MGLEAMLLRDMRREEERLADETADAVRQIELTEAAWARVGEARRRREALQSDLEQRLVEVESCPDSHDLNPIRQSLERCKDLEREERALIDAAEAQSRAAKTAATAGMGRVQSLREDINRLHRIVYGTDYPESEE